MSSLFTSLLENLKAGQLHSFHGGVHPPERKEPANLTPISDAGLPEELVLQVRQHIGQAAQLSVSVGERVLKGQALTEPLNPMMVPVHAPTSGVIGAIEDRSLCHPSGLNGLCIVLKPDGRDEWRARFPVADYQLLEPGVLLTRIHQAGITGLGGAGFPAHVKLAARQPAPLQSDSKGDEKNQAGQTDGIDTLIINGVECEPYISADDRLMREHAREILQGIDILRHIVKPKLTILAVEDNKPEALAALLAAHQAATDTGEQHDNLQIIAVPTKYPSGGQKQLIEVLTGIQVPQHSLSSDVGIIMQNVGTVFAIQQAIIEDEPLIRRVITLAGEAFTQPGNAWVHIGTPVRYLLQRYGLVPEPEQRIIMGGPMMGFTLHSAAAPIIKGSNCVLAPKELELSPPAEEMACIRCSACADACPASLLPQQLYWYARSEEHDKLESHDLFDCIECGACAYVCPSNIPLVQYYRVAKADIRQARHEAEQAERAKERFEARQARLELEKAERQARQAKAAAERKARMAEQAAKTGEDPVAAALARVKARQLADTAAAGTTSTGDDMSALRAARKEEARRNRALKAAQTDAAASSDQSSAAESTADTASASAVKNPAVAAALARAKARRAQQEMHEAAQPPPAKHQTGAPKNAAPIDAKKAAIKAAVERAKARQAAEHAAALAKSATDVEPPAVAENKIETKAESKTESMANSTAAANAKQAAIQAAVARAKARQAAKAAVPAVEPQAPETPASGEPDAATAKQAAIKAAVARAKARQAAKAQATAPEPSAGSAADETPAAADPAAAKQAAIKAAVARAKARQAAKAADAPAESSADSQLDASSNKEDQS